MQPLSLPLADWLKSPQSQAPLDAVVVGSGYGGSVAALRLAQQGHRVVVLERGSEFLPGEFPNDIGQVPKFMRFEGPTGPQGSACGLFDWRAGPGYVALAANGVGGGSLINAGVMMRPDDDVFAQAAWPVEIRHGLDAELALALPAAFARAAAMLGGEVYVDAPGAAGGVSALPKAQALKRLGDTLRKHGPVSELQSHAQPATVTIDLAKCTRCGDCASGCNVEDAKKTLPTTYLAEAFERGVRIVSRCQVHWIEAVRNGGWDLCVVPTERSLHARRVSDAVELHGTTLHARLVVIAAGTFGSTELLMRSQRRANALTLSPMLGSRLSGNGDGIDALSDEPTPVDAIGHGADTATLPPPPLVGPTITTLLDLRTGGPGADGSGVTVVPPLDRRLVVQEGAVPGALARVYEETLATLWALRRLGTRGGAPRSPGRAADPAAASPALARHSQLLLTMGHDGSKGRIVWVPERDGVVPYWDRPQDEITFAHREQVFAAAEKGKGVHLQSPLWRLLPDGVAELADGPPAEPMLMTVQPLGGCPMGDGWETGVVNHLGQVWRAPHQVWNDLYVLDGSIVPTSLGCNPLWTITALAERAMAHRAALRLHSQTQPQPSAKPPGPVLPILSPRTPRALSRRAAPTFDVGADERLEVQHLALHGPLREALGVDVVESDLVVRMRHADWRDLWVSARHRITDVCGRLRLVAEPSPGAWPPPDVARALPTPHRLEYEITGGHVDLLSPRDRVPLWGSLCRLSRLARVAATWLVLRGCRELRAGGLGFDRDRWRTALRLAWQATEERSVDYDLRLRLAASHGTKEQPPALLRLRGRKHVAYAATCVELLRWCVRRSRDPAWPRSALRAGLLEQLLCPEITLDAGATIASRLPAWLGRCRTRARYRFDLPAAARRFPLVTLAGGDSSAAIATLLSYPTLVARFLLSSRLLEFGLPKYSGTPVVDDAGEEDVKLRMPAGQPPVHPTEFRLEVQRGDSSSDDGTEGSAPIALRLWRYARRDARGAATPPTVQSGTWCGCPVRRVRSVLLVHAFDMSGYSFTFKSTAQNFAEYLYTEGWEVWILDTRFSVRAQTGELPSTLDQTAMIDVPQAVDHMLSVLRGEVGDGAPLQVFAFGQCLGAAVLQMALAGGGLSHPVEAQTGHRSADDVRPLMPKLAALVSSQTHMFTIGARSAQARTRIPHVLRNLSLYTRIPFSVRGPVEAVVEATADRLLAVLPVPPGETCPNEGEPSRRHDDDCATCRRLRFLLSGLFRHANLDEKTHLELPKLFGIGNIRMLAHGAKSFEYERFVTEDGFNAYATDAAIGRHMALPVRFVHGAENEFFDAESAIRSAQQMERIHPAWVQQFGLPGPNGRAACEVLPGYGHVDVLIGKAAPYARLADLLQAVWSGPRDQPAQPSTAQEQRLVVRFPKAGPWLGPVYVEEGVNKCHVVFVVDDGTAEAQRVMTEASAIVHGNGPPHVVPLDVAEFYAPLAAVHGFVAAAGAGPQPVALRVARGTLKLQAGAGPLRVECVSHTTALAPQRLMTSTVLLGGASVRIRPSAPVGLPQLRAAIDAARRAARAARRLARRPFPGTASQRRLEPPNGVHRWITAPRACLEPPAADAAVRFAIGCCRYPGFGFDRERVDEAFVHLRARLNGGRAPELMFMLGDQIYADATAGFVDPLSSWERYFHRHQQVYETPAVRRVLSRLPLVSVLDDHEFVESYPLAAPLFRGTSGARPYALQREAAARISALAAALGYQLLPQPLSAALHGWFAFDRGPVRFFVVDTRRARRRDRRGRVAILPPGAETAFDAWLAEGQHTSALHCLVTGSVIAPGLVPGCNPAHPDPPDTMQAAEDERRRLLDKLVAMVPGRFVLLSGDYHVSWCGLIERDTLVVGAAVVAPPFNAPLPFANKAPSDLWLTEHIVLPTAGCLTLRSVGPAPQRGSGYGVLECRRVGRNWSIALETELTDLECGTGWQHTPWPVARL